MPLSSLNFFRYQKISGKQKGLFKKLLISVLWDESSYKTVMPPFPMHANLAWKKFSKHQSILQWNILVQWDKNFDGKSWYSPLPIQTFSIPETNETLKDSPY